MRFQFAGKFFRGGFSLFEYDRQGVVDDVIEVISNAGGDFDIVDDGDDGTVCDHGCDGCKSKLKMGFGSTQ